MATIETSDSLKMVKEALCVATVDLRHTAEGHRARRVLLRLLADVDRRRPVDADGKHRRHTVACGCRERPLWLRVLGVVGGWDR